MTMHKRLPYSFPSVSNPKDRRYGNTGCRVFKRGVQNQKIFLPKNQRIKRKLLKFKHWCNRELSKSAKI